MPEVTKTQEEKSISLPNVIVIKDLAQRLALPVNRVMTELMKNGVMSSMNERIDYETAAIIAEDLGYKVTLEHDTAEVDRQKTVSQELKDLLKKDDATLQILRPPVVVVMGHVDHGKTKLLDTIRQTDIMAREAGGITQHIGAYQVEKKGRPITFIDTPGHEAFSAMRSRGAHVADIAILVVAADDGIKPQTLEALKIIQYAGLPFIVAINKVDKPEANVERVKKQLAELNLLPEDWGGKTVTVPVSAQSNIGIDDLLDTILLVADLEQEHLKADPRRGAVGSVIEAHIDKGEGPVATVLIHTGVLRRGAWVKIGNVAGKVKLLKDWHGQELPEVGPSTPAKMLGLKSSPEVGDIVQTVSAEDVKGLRRTQKIRGERVGTRVVYTSKKSQSEEKGPLTEQKKLNIVLRTDNLGSQEAILESLAKYETPNTAVEVVAKGLGNITDADVLRAETAHALLIGFHVIPTPRALDVAKGKHVDVHTYDVIYDLLNAVKQELENLLPVEHVETVLGHLRVLAVFRKEKTGMIVGGRVIDGIVSRGTNARVVREGSVLATGSVSELQQDKRAVAEVKSGGECGIRFQGEPMVEVNDTLEFFKVEERRTKLKLP